MVFLKGRGIVLSEPSVVAIDNESGKIVRVGCAAKEAERTRDNVGIVKPLRGGAVADFEGTQAMLSHFVRMAQPPRGAFGALLGPRTLVCVPSGITSLELWAIKEIVESVGARQVFTIEAPLAAAIGAGLPINKPRGTMVVDIGAGTSEAAVISLGGIV